MNIDVRSAVNSLVPNNASHIENEKITLWESAETQPTEAEIDAEVIRLQAEYVANKFQRDRASKFPELKEQLDLLFHDMTSGKGTKDGEWYKAVAKVKSDNPKP